MPTLNSKSIQIKQTRIPVAVLEACTKLVHAGFKAWLAGGCVRDMLLTRKPRDWDIVTDAPLDTIRELFPRHLEVGKAFGIIKLIPIQATETEEPVHIDIAVFRKEGGYSDHRHPDKIEVGDLHSDVARRDFTVNAMYFDPATQDLIDEVGGYKDLSAKILRTVGSAHTRFSEDALRVLRTARFAAQLGFKIDRQTTSAMKQCAPLLTEISRERIREEVVRLLESQKPITGLEAIAQNGLWEQVFGIRRVSLPADFRHLKLNWNPTFLHWLCALAVTGMFGDPLAESQEITKRLSLGLRLSNPENRILRQSLRVYEDSLSKAPASQALDWVHIAREDKHLIELLKAFIRRARGPTQEEKDGALALLDQALRWAAKPGSESSWPSSGQLMKEGIESGPKLGRELKTRQWKAFWERRP